MITLTARHGIDDELKPLLARLKRAKRSFHGRKAWTRRIKPKIAGKILTAMEVTHGRSGWHPHYHGIFFAKGLSTEEIEALGDVWRDCLDVQGLFGNGAAFDVRSADEAGAYLAKWGAAEELTLNGQKKGKRAGRTPLQLLEASKAGNSQAGDLWLEYRAAFAGTAQLDGLGPMLKLAGVQDVSDKEAANDDRQDDQEREVITNVETAKWRKTGRTRYCETLDAAEEEGAAGVHRVIDGPAVARSLSQPPPMKTGGLSERALSAVRDTQTIEAGGKPPAPPSSGTAASRASGGAGGGVGSVQREGTVPGATHPPRSTPAGYWRRRRAGAENVTQITVSERATTAGVE